MHKLKELAIKMKEVILKGKLDKMGELLNLSWDYKKQNGRFGISNQQIDKIYNAAIEAGATGGR